MKCLFCKRTIKDNIFHICPSRVPSMGRMGIPRNKHAAKYRVQPTIESGREFPAEVVKVESVLPAKSD